VAAHGSSAGTREPAATAGALAAMLGLPPDTIASRSLWMDTGAEQLVIPLANEGEVWNAA
jgi:predicted PhzF superfamily epimerase YddE/YHI9